MRDYRLYNADAADIEKFPLEPFDLAIFSTPYPGMLGFGCGNESYFGWWMPERLNAIASCMKKDGVIIQNLWLPRVDGWYDDNIFKIIKVYKVWDYHLIEPYIWDKLNAPPAGDHKKYDRNQWEFCFAFARTRHYTYHKFRQPYAAKTVGKASSGNMRKSDINGQLAGGHADLHPEGAAQGNIIRASPSGDQNRPRIKDRVFPRDLAERLILQYSNPGDWVLDPFCGSGTTLVSALKHGRKAVGCDINPDNVLVAKEWLESLETTSVN